MDITVVREYLEIKKQRPKLESQFRKLGGELDAVRAKETELSAKVDIASLISTKSVKVINEILESHRPLWLGVFPVSFAHATFDKGELHVSVIFSQPLFSGWRTEIPYISWQGCSLSLETPEPPGENHIPQYTQVMELGQGTICWEQSGTELRLWIDEKRGLVFRWGSRIGEGE